MPTGPVEDCPALGARGGGGDVDHLRGLRDERPVLFWLVLLVGFWLGFQFLLFAAQLIPGPFALPGWAPPALVVAVLVLVARGQQRSRWRTGNSAEGVPSADVAARRSAARAPGSVLGAGRDPYTRAAPRPRPGAGERGRRRRTRRAGRHGCPRRGVDLSPQIPPGIPRAIEEDSAWV